MPDRASVWTPVGLPMSQAAARELRAAYNLDLACVTRGESGSLLAGEFESDEHPGFKVQVADTVGVGDAFTAGLVHLFKTHVASTNERSRKSNGSMGLNSTRCDASSVPTLQTFSVNFDDPSMSAITIFQQLSSRM